jgi:ATP-dependent Clp protease protease subunit
MSSADSQTTVEAEGAAAVPSNPPQENIAYLSFSAEVSQKTTEALLGVCAQYSNKGIDKLYLLLSSPGGNVMNGLTIYNLLRGLPYEIVTHNVGQVNSIANVVFLAGDERYASPDSTFMFHGVGFNVPGNTRFEEKKLRERLQSVQSDQDRIASIIINRSDISEEEADTLFLEAQTKDPKFALDRRLIHDIREVEIPRGAPFNQLVFER